jgi:mRNA interferase YafQ
MYKINRSNQFKKDVKLCIKRNFDMEVLKNAIKKLEENGELPSHPLQGGISYIFDHHLRPDWLLLFSIDNIPEYEKETKIIFDGTIHLFRTGTHSDLFK